MVMEFFCSNKGKEQRLVWAVPLLLYSYRYCMYMYVYDIIIIWKM